MDLRQKLNIPADAKRAIIDTKLNGETLSRDTRGSKVGTGFYKLGHEFVEKDDGESQKYLLHSWTVEDGMHVLNSTFTVEKSGKFVEGVVNCFALGMMPGDEGYFNQMIEELDTKELVWTKLDF